MAQNFDLKLHQPQQLWPLQVIVICENQKEVKTIKSQVEMNQLLEEVKLYNSENDNKKRIISAINF